MLRKLRSAIWVFKAWNEVPKTRQDDYGEFLIECPMKAATKAGTSK